jgi:hypothetical protein
MAIARGVTQFSYVLEEERKLPPEKQTRWKLKTLEYAEAEELEGLQIVVDAFVGRQYVVNGLKKARLALNVGLLGWENFRDEGGSEITFRGGSRDDRRAIPDELLSLIRPTWAMELANAIRNEASLDLETAKNS